MDKNTREKAIVNSYSPMDKELSRQCVSMIKSMCNSARKELELVMNKHNVCKEHAGCYIVNGGIDSYICKEYSGGCKRQRECADMREKDGL